MRVAWWLLGTACVSASEVRIVENGEDIRLTSESVSIVQGFDGPLTVLWRGTEDPLCRASDDEVDYQVTLFVPHPTAVPLGQRLDVRGDDGPVEVSMTSTCFCHAEDVIHHMRGSVRLHSLSASDVAGELSLVLQGDLPHRDDVSLRIDGSFAGPGERTVRCW